MPQRRTLSTEIIGRAAIPGPIGSASQLRTSQRLTYKDKRRQRGLSWLIAIRQGTASGWLLRRYADP